MSLAYAILGLLQEEERTGYGLKTTCFDRTVAHLWSADQAQIYKTLDKLVERGWITCTVEIQYERPNRKVCSVTEAGKAELVRWLQCHQPLPTIREPLLVQLFFAAELPNDAIVHLLLQQLVAHREKLANCENNSENNKLPPLGDRSASREQVVQRLVLELVMRKEQTYIDWLSTAIDLISCQKEE